jgi:hypothetical protein
MNPIKSLARRLARTEYIQGAIREKANLDEFKKPPPVKLVIGLIVLTVAQLMGLPAAIAAAAAGAWLGDLRIVLLGPAAYVVSWGVFGLAMLLIGPDTVRYAHIMVRWMARMGVEKVLGDEIRSRNPDHT